MIIGEVRSKNSRCRKAQVRGRMSSNEWQSDTGANDFDRTARRALPLVVLVEDNDDCRRVYSLILRHYRYDVAEATNGADAVELIRRLRPSLVLMDIGLPGMDGFQASRLLKSDPETSSIPLIAFSARVDSTADLVGGNPTFDGFILKPVSPQELVRRVNAYMALLCRRPTPIDRSAYWSDGPDEAPREQTLSA
jgi:two-component system cell cycle response regulator DivK